MAAGATEQGGAEWRVDVAAGERDNGKGGGGGRISRAVKAAWDGAAGFGKMVWKVGADDPRRVVHGFKVALALTLCSLFYYVRPLYLFAGEKNAMWAVLTVVVVFEYTVGGCLYKGLNRAMATMVGGALALAVHWVADQAPWELQPYVLTSSLFVMAAVATFSRFIPTMKSKFDYGVTVFILTYCLVSVSGYRASEVVTMAQHRLVTIAIGAFICFAVCALVFPVWAGQELHVLAARCLEKLAAAVEGCVEEYFAEEKTARRAPSEKTQAYRFVLNAKASEDSLANLARWEPGHGRFGFRHPYGQYQKIGAAMRCCAYCVDALAACIGSEAQTPAHVRKHLAGACLALSRHFAAVLREASGCVTSMTRSDRLALAVADMNAASQDLRDELRCLATILEEEGDVDVGVDVDGDESAAEAEQNGGARTPPLMEALPLFSAASLLLEACARAERVIGAVETLATVARFKKADHDEKTTLDAEAPVSISISAGSTNAISADASQETHGKTPETTTTTTAAAAEKANASSEQGPRDQVGQLMKVLMRRRSTKKWSRGDTKVTPKPPLEFAVHVPSPRNRALELAGHAPAAAAPTPRGRAAPEHAGHAPPVAPSPRNRSMDFAGHGPVAPSPRNRSMEFAAHAPTPRNRSILGMA